MFEYFDYIDSVAMTYTYVHAIYLIDCTILKKILSFTQRVL